MSNIPITSLPVATALDGSEAVPIVQGGTTKRTTTADIGNTATGFVPSTRTINTPTAGGLTGGGSLASDLTLYWAPANLNPKTAMVVADTFAINDSALTAPAQVTFPNAMKALTGLSELLIANPLADYLLINDAASGLSKKINISNIIAATGNVPAGGTTGQPLVKNSGTNYDSSWQTLPVIGGGTGQIIYTAGDILYADTTTSLAKLSDVAVGSVLVSGGVGVGPAYSATPSLTSLALGGASIGSNALAATGTINISSTVTGGTFVPTLNSIPTDGMYLNAAGQVAFAAGSTRIFFINSAGLLMANASGATLTSSAATATAATVVPRRSDSGTGIGSSGTGSISLIATSVEQLRINNGSIYVGGAATGTNTAALASPISGGLSTGNATNPDLVFQTGVATVSGASQATATTALTLKGETQAAIFAGPVTLSAGLNTPLVGQYGGTGVANTGKTITLGGNLTTSGAFASTFTMTGITAVTFPTSGTLATTGGASIPSIAQGDLLYGSATNVLSALTKDTNATRYLSNTGTTNNPAWAQVALGTGVSGQLPLANGGTNANLTASNGGIFYSTASAAAILSGTATANQHLASGASGSPSWTTATYPATAAAGTVLAAGTANTISATATPTLGIAGSVVGSLAFANATSGSITLAPATGALGSVTLTLPAATDTVAVLAASQALTNKTYNGLTITSTTGTFTVTNAKTLSVSNSLTLAGTDGTTMTFPGTSSSVLTTGNTATLTVGYTFTPNNIGTVSSGTTTPVASSGNYQYLTNNGAFTLAAPSSDSAIDVLVTNGASAGVITFSGFTVGSSTGSSLTTTNGNKFLISIRRINGTATYSIYALQ